MKVSSIYLVIFVFIYVEEAGATHKAWVLKNSGGQCVLQVPTVREHGNISYPGIVHSENLVNAFVICPITLSSRGGSSLGPIVSTKFWIEAKHARIYFKKGRSPYWCRARAEDFSGNVFHGRIRGKSDEGYNFIDLIVRENDTFGGGNWARSWGNLSDFTMQLEYECALGSGSSSNPAKLIGYDVAICQSRRGCSTVDARSARGRATVQGSGIECVPSTDAGGPFLRRNVRGMRNTGNSTYSTHCPITQAADDSYEHRREIHSSGTQLTFAGRRPTCRIESIDEEGGEVSSPDFEVRDDLYPNRLQPTGTFETDKEKSLSIRCDVPPGSTIEGYTVEMSVTRKSGGI